MLHVSKQIHSVLQEASHILLVPHQNPDGDAIGSVGALAEYLINQLQKKVDIFCLTAVPPSLHFVPHSHLVSSDELIWQVKTIDTILVVDSGDLRYAGINKFVKSHQAQIINIDHHPTNDNYGHINLINPSASSTAEIIFDFFQANNLKLNKQIATALLTGILTDTGNFTNGATSMRALNIASSLLKSGARIREINQWTLKNNTIDILKLWGIVLNRLEYDANKDLAYTYLTQADYKKFNLDEKEVEGISNFMNTVGGVKMGLFLKETTDGKIKGSFRTTYDDVDVSVLAKQFGGGGHKKAAGFTVENQTISSVLDRILTS